MLIQLTRNEMIFKKQSMSENGICAIKNLVERERGYGGLVFMSDRDGKITVKAPRSTMFLFLHKLSQHFTIELM